MTDFEEEGKQKTKYFYSLYKVVQLGKHPQIDRKGFSKKAKERGDKKKKKHKKEK